MACLLHGLSAIQCLSYIRKHSFVDLHPNISVTLKTFLPVTAASCERDFSKLKLILTTQHDVSEKALLVYP